MAKRRAGPGTPVVEQADGRWIISAGVAQAKLAASATSATAQHALVVERAAASASKPPPTCTPFLSKQAPADIFESGALVGVGVHAAAAVLLCSCSGRRHCSRVAGTPLAGAAASGGLGE